MSEDEVDLTVVIACLNAAETIGAQLAALAEQPCPVPWEVLICDNGSTDGTAQVVQALAGHWKGRLPLRYLDASATSGAGAARNAGAAHARGRRLAFCDADDVVGEGWLAAMVEALSGHAFVAGRFDGTRLNSARALRSRPLDQQQGLQFAPGAIDLPHAGAGNMGIERELFRRVGGFDESLPCLEDTDLSWRVQLRCGVPLHFAQDAVVHVRLRPRPGAMYRQGRAYGAAYAALQSRYVTAHGTADGSPATGEAPGPHRSRWLRARAALRVGVEAFPSVGHLVWQLGWHRGFHRGLVEPAISRTANTEHRIQLGPVTKMRDAE